MARAGTTEDQVPGAGPVVDAPERASGGSRWRTPLRGRLDERLVLRIAVALPFGWLFVFLLLPTVLMLTYSFWNFEAFVVTRDWTLENYQGLVSPSNVMIFLFTLKIALIVVVIGLPASYLAAMFISTLRGSIAYVLLLIIIMPFLTNVLVRIFAWKTLLGRSGVINDSLAGVGIPRLDDLLFSETSLVLVLLYGTVPFMTLPIYASLRRVSPEVLLAARDLGAGSGQILMKIIIPLTKPGIMMAGLLAFITVLGSSLEAEQVGGPSTLMWGQLILSQSFEVGDLPQAAALAFVTGGFTLGVILAVLQYVRLDSFFQGVSGSGGRR